MNPKKMLDYFRKQSEEFRKEMLKYEAEENKKAKEVLDRYEAGQATPEDMELIEDLESVFYCP